MCVCAACDVGLGARYMVTFGTINVTNIMMGIESGCGLRARSVITCLSNVMGPLWLELITLCGAVRPCFDCDGVMT